jgi:hypothetical protein
MSKKPTIISTVTQLHLNSDPTASEQSPYHHLNSEPYRYLNSDLTASQQSLTVQMQLQGRYSGEILVRGDVSLSGLILQLSLSAKEAASCAAARREEVLARLLYFSKTRTKTQRLEGSV